MKLILNELSDGFFEGRVFSVDYISSPCHVLKVLVGRYVKEEPQLFYIQWKHVKPVEAAKWLEKVYKPIEIVIEDGAIVDIDLNPAPEIEVIRK
jgi:hypothetical protein